MKHIQPEPLTSYRLVINVITAIKKTLTVTIDTFLYFNMAIFAILFNVASIVSVIISNFFLLMQDTTLHYLIPILAGAITLVAVMSIAGGVLVIYLKRKRSRLGRHSLSSIKMKRYQ